MQEHRFSHSPFNQLFLKSIKWLSQWINISKEFIINGLGLALEINIGSTLSCNSLEIVFSIQTMTLLIKLNSFGELSASFSLFVFVSSSLSLLSQSVWKGINWLLILFPQNKSMARLTNFKPLYFERNGKTILWECNIKVIIHCKCGRATVLIKAMFPLLTQETWSKNFKTQTSSLFNFYWSVQKKVHAKSFGVFTGWHVCVL